MQLRFIRGDAQAPRGHAIVIARPYGQPGRALATYCIVLPIQFSIARFLPPILTSQMPMEGLQDLSGSPSVMPVPPILDEVADVDALIALAELRDDDVVEIDGVNSSNDGLKMELAAESSAEYGRLYATYTAQRNPPARQRDPIGFRAGSQSNDQPAAIEPEHLEAIIGEAPAGIDHEQLREISRLIGTLRYALEGNDLHQIEETKRSLRRAVAPLSEKFRADELIDAALIPGERGQKLADLYLMRAYKLADEDYPAIPALEEQIRAMNS